MHAEVTAVKAQIRPFILLFKLLIVHMCLYDRHYTCTSFTKIRKKKKILLPPSTAHHTNGNGNKCKGRKLKNDLLL